MKEDIKDIDGNVILSVKELKLLLKQYEEDIVKRATEKRFFRNKVILEKREYSSIKTIDYNNIAEINNLSFILSTICEYTKYIEIKDKKHFINFYYIKKSIIEKEEYSEFLIIKSLKTIEELDFIISICNYRFLWNNFNKLLGQKTQIKYHFYSKIINLVESGKINDSIKNSIYKIENYGLGLWENLKRSKSFLHYVKLNSKKDILSK